MFPIYSKLLTPPPPGCMRNNALKRNVEFGQIFCQSQKPECVCVCVFIKVLPPFHPAPPAAPPAAPPTDSQDPPHYPPSPQPTSGRRGASYGSVS